MELLGIDETLNALIGCVCAALEEVGAPVCTCATTIGTPAIGRCCECGDGKEGELWGNLIRTYRVTEAGYADARPQKPCTPAKWAAEYQITLARCFPTLDERANLPSPEDRSAAATALHADVATLHRALHCCTETEPPYLNRIGVESDPEGGCSFLVASVSVPVSMKPGKNPR